MTTEAPKPRRVFVGRKEKSIDSTEAGTAIARKTVRRAVNQIPQDILDDVALNEAIKLLPSNYNFEIHKSVWNVRKQDAKRVALQMPEGLLVYACIIADILEQFCGIETLVMGDVTYGACCIDDFTATALGCDMMIHYAHSCLVPIDVTKLKVLYVFVTIEIDKTHLVKTLAHELAGKNIALVSTIQFNPTLHKILAPLAQQGITAYTPQAMPLSKGEVLGCTSAKVQDSTDAIVYVGDGRFHLESAMIHNPSIPAYKYDPYDKSFTIEEFDHDLLMKTRKSAIDAAKSASQVGLILGALGRQGNPKTLKMLETAFEKKGVAVVKVVLSEIFPQKLAQFCDVDCWVQVACPRLSIDWGYAFPKPLLTPYEAMVAIGQDSWQSVYPMDYYSSNGYGRAQQPRKGLEKQTCNECTCGKESCETFLHKRDSAKSNATSAPR